jgi:hypothetical protein
MATSSPNSPTDKTVCSICGSISELSGAPSEIRRKLYRQNEVQETLLSLFPIYRRLPKLAVALTHDGMSIRNILDD